MSNTQLIADLRALDAVFTTAATWTRARLVLQDTTGTLCHCLAGGVIKVVSNPKLPGDYLNQLLFEPRAQHMVKALGFNNQMEIFRYNDKADTTFRGLKETIHAAIRKLAPSKGGRPRKIKDAQ